MKSWTKSNLNMDVGVSECSTGQAVSEWVHHTSMFPTGGSCINLRWVGANWAVCHKQTPQQTTVLSWHHTQTDSCFFPRKRQNEIVVIPALQSNPRTIYTVQRHSQKILSVFVLGLVASLTTLPFAVAYDNWSATGQLHHKFSRGYEFGGMYSRVAL